MGQLNITDDLTPTWCRRRCHRGNCLQRARGLRLLTRQLDASEMTDDSLNVDAQTRSDAWLHSHTAGVPGNIWKDRWYCGIDRKRQDGRNRTHDLWTFQAANKSRVEATGASFCTHPPDSITSLHLIRYSITEVWNLITAGDADGSYHPTGRSNYSAGWLSWSTIPEWDVCLIIAAL